MNELKTRQHNKVIVNVEAEQIKVVIVSCGHNLYAFYGTEIREILPACKIYWVPGLPDYLPGLINVRGDIESVIDVAYFLDESRENPVSRVAETTPMIVMAVLGDFHSGILIDAVLDVVDIPAGSIRPPLSTLGGTVRDLVTGGMEHKGQTVSLISVGQLATMVSAGA